MNDNKLSAFDLIHELFREDNCRVVYPVDVYDATRDFKNFIWSSISKFLGEILEKDSFTYDKTYTLTIVFNSKICRKKKNWLTFMRFLFDQLNCKVMLCGDVTRFEVTFSKEYTSTVFEFEKPHEVYSLH